MKKFKRVIETTETGYEALHGTNFYNEGDCIRHEWEASKTPLWAAHLRGSRSDAIEIYETEELANLATSKNSKYVVSKVYVNERNWVDEWKLLKTCDD